MQNNTELRLCRGSNSGDYMFNWKGQTRMESRNPTNRCIALALPANLLIALALMLSISCKVQSEAICEDNGEQWISLFDGETLDGWTPKFAGYELGKNVADTFRVKDGILKVAYDQYETFNNRFGHLFYDTPFSHYRLRVEYRFVGDQVPGGPGWAFRNNGIMFHSQDPNTMGRDQFFPVSIEAQLLGGDGENERPNLSVCTPGTYIVIDGQVDRSHCISSSSETFHGDQWVTAEIEVRGGEVIRHYANGTLVMEYHQPRLDASHNDAKPLINDGDTLLTGGYIALQAESHPTEFRAIEILLLE